MLRSRLNSADNFQQGNEDQDIRKDGEVAEAGEDNERGNEDRHQYPNSCFLKFPIPDQHNLVLAVCIGCAKYNVKFPS
jgi:hypothetical protein